ncbi:hypothetical protein D0863_04676 [Hortaea werneckii]|uniref:Cupin type-1 domain-containing protein n=1 Tax=Hortaea werneckii TaxID=91943 RepID=A0A3M7E6E3_HORWE|nr:hypothetical protein D0863_04676 [Hortaea werneckii]
MLYPTMFRSTLAALTASLFITSTLAAMGPTTDSASCSALKGACSQADRLNILGSDDDWLFDFNDYPETYNFAPGGVTTAKASTFPATVENGMSMAMLNMGPCAMLPPHWHPRASNYVVTVLGSVTTYMWEENGARLVTEKLTPGKMTIFPQGSMHMMVNTGCENAQVVSALNSPDAGTANVGQVFANGFPAPLVNAAFGWEVAGPFAKSKMLPPGTGVNWGSQECLQRCGIHPNGTSTPPNNMTY